jgi:hypothetical protein
LKFGLNTGPEALDRFLESQKKFKVYAAFFGVGLSSLNPTNASLLSGWKKSTSVDLFHIYFLNS